MVGNESEYWPINLWLGGSQTLTLWPAAVLSQGPLIWFNCTMGHPKKCMQFRTRKVANLCENGFPPAFFKSWRPHATSNTWRVKIWRPRRLRNLWSRLRIYLTFGYKKIAYTDLKQMLVLVATSHFDCLLILPRLPLHFLIDFLSCSCGCHAQNPLLQLHFVLQCYFLDLWWSGVGTMRVNGPQRTSCHPVHSCNLLALPSKAQLKAGLKDCDDQIMIDQ